MSQLTAGMAGAPHGHGHGHAGDVLRPENVTLAPGAGMGLSLVLMVAGLLGIGGTAVGYFTVSARHALASYLVGAAACVGICLGALALLMSFHLINAGWSSVLRRQVENIAGMLRVALALFAVFGVLAVGTGAVYGWMGDTYAGDPLLEHKAPFLNLPFFLVRAAIYVVVWLALERTLHRLSRRQDETGDPALTARARTMSSWGMVLFALTSTFAAFDWLMTLDYHFFSTMWGVYFFAGNMLAGTATTCLVLLWIRSTGRLEGVVTREHFHDLGKLMLAFTVFWAYITFSQYFLIWYANIPEETAWFQVRRSNGWEVLGPVLAIGHFAVPFFLLLWKGTKRSPVLLGGLAVLALVMHLLDLYFIVRPVVYKGAAGFEHWWLDLAGAAGPLCLMLGLLVRSVASGPLIAMKDPRLPEGLAHHNYV